MTDLSPGFWRRGGLAFFICGLVLCVASVGLLVAHTRVFSEKRNTAVMIGTILPELKTRVAILAANTEAEQIFEKNALTSSEEQAAIFVLPENPSGTRVARVLQQIVNSINKKTKADPVSISKISFAHNAANFGSIKTLSGSIMLSGNYQSVARLLQILFFSGDMMVKDALSGDIRDEILLAVESSAPMSLPAAENFLYMDFLQYASDPDGYENQMVRDMPARTAVEIKTALLESGVSRIRAALSPVASDLLDGNAWPLPLMRVDYVSRQGQIWKIDFTVFGR